MVLQSGAIPYEYAIRKGRFESKPIPIGISGVLLEQAQFVITAELRKWTGVSHVLPDFHVYVNTNIVPSGPYEPKALGTTLDNLLNPGACIFTDNITECRAALNTLLNLYGADTDLVDMIDYRRAWIQSVFPESPSGFILGIDEQAFVLGVGHWRHRRASETGLIEYVSDEILGSSGVLYDIDFAEVMFNPAPHISSMGFDDTHGRLVNNSTDPFLIQQYPIFPAFQKTDGSIITTTGREPTSLRLTGYNILHVPSGCIRVHGYALMPQTRFVLSREVIFDTTSDFTFFSEGIRAPFSPNVPTTVAFITPIAQASGVYRLGAVNSFGNFPNATIESGVFGHWPIPGVYWPSDSPTNSTTTRANGGYHVFDDCLWMTDRNADASFGGPNFGYPSGLSILSPHTGHRLWVRYADMTPITVNTLISTFRDFNWATAVGLQRISTDTIRLMPFTERPTTSASGKFVFGQYNDNLDLLSDIRTTSDYFTGSNEVPLGGDGMPVVHDFWFDGSDYYVTANQFVGFDLWKFDSTFHYVTKYGFNSPSGIHAARGAFVNGKNVLFHGFLENQSVVNFAQSGIFPINFITDGTDPFDNSASPPFVGEAEISFATVKYINGAGILGVAQNAEIMDLFEVTSATHVVPGVYAIVRFKMNTSPFDGGDLYLLRLVETANSWEIAALTRMEISIGSFSPRRELTYMAY